MKIDNLTQAVTQSTGSGAMILGSVSGRRRFYDAFGDKDCYYFISHRMADEWEVGIGHMSDAETLVRDSVFQSSNDGDPVNFSAGIKDVVNDLPADVQGQLETLSSDLAAKMSASATTSSVAEGSNLYFTNARAQAALMGLYESPLILSTGLTRSTNTITANLSAGVSGGQTAVGGTASGNSLTLSSTSNVTKGKIVFGTASAYDEANDRLGLGATSPAHKLDIVQSLSGSQTARALNIAATWNVGTSTPTLISANVTDTASNASSLLMDLQRGGVSQFKVDKNGALTVNGAMIGGQALSFGFGLTNTPLGFAIGRNFSTGSMFDSGRYGYQFTRPGAVDRLDLEVYDGAGNFVGYGARWDAVGGLRIGLVTVTGSLSSSALDLSTTWNTTGTPTLLFANVTDTGSNVASLLMDLRVGNVTQMKLSKGGKLTAAAFSANGVDGVDGTFTTANGKTVTVTKGLITAIV